MQTASEGIQIKEKINKNFSVCQSQKFHELNLTYELLLCKSGVIRNYQERKKSVLKKLQLAISGEHFGGSSEGQT